jgi:hypothetical protein
MINPKIFLLNGPPRSGKDTLADWCVDENPHSFLKQKMAEPLKKSVQELFSLSDEQVELFDNDSELKDKPQDIFYGVSWRQAVIDLCEIYVKKHYDTAFFGHSLVNRIKNNTERQEYFLISDSGFKEEAAPVVKEFGIDNVFLLRIIRPNHDFSGDSRTYWDNELGIAEYHIQNNQDQLSFCNYGLRLIEDLIIGN